MSKVYEYVQKAIIEKLEAAIENGGCPPWKKPWNGVGFVNYISRKPYRGINLILLPEPGEYITYKQIQDLRKKDSSILLKANAKKHMVVFWQYKNKKNSKGEETEQIYPVLQFYKVFNIKDVENLKSKSSIYNHNPIEKAEEMIENFKMKTGIELNICPGADRAYYSLTNDSISVPCKEQYKNISEYYSTLFHEMVHATGHPDRLSRFDLSTPNIFASESYSKEELVAEIGATMLMGELGINTVESESNSIAYLRSWLRVIQDDVRFITSASQMAQKSLDFINDYAYENENVA